MRNRKARRVKARYQWDRMKVNFWFAPVIMSVGAIILAWVMYRIDSLIPNQMLESSRIILAGSPGEIRVALVGMASTILATAGVVFTLLTLPLSTVAAQYGSRLLRVFLGDRTTQLVLGMFVATFVYCVAAALSIPPASVEPEGPQITATVGLLLLMGCFASLVLLIQHISTMLQAPNIAAAAGAELREAVLAEIPEAVASGDGSTHTRAAQEPPTVENLIAESDCYPIRVKETGYIEYIDPETLVTVARENDLVIRLLRKPGRFVRRGDAVAKVCPPDRVDEQVAEQIRRAFSQGNTRTPAQDLGYAVNQLVEMAVRAMSPAINDPFTAMTCLDYLSEGLALFIRQGEKSAHFYDREGRLRLVLEPVTFEELVDTAFNMLRHASCDNASVLLHMLDIIDEIGREAKSPQARRLLVRHVNLIQSESQAGELIEQDRELIQRCAETLNVKLNEAL